MVDVSLCAHLREDARVVVQLEVNGAWRDIFVGRLRAASRRGHKLASRRGCRVRIIPYARMPPVVTIALVP